jgi:hypothetical protein
MHQAKEDNAANELQVGHLLSSQRQDAGLGQRRAVAEHGAGRRELVVGLVHAVHGLRVSEAIAV